MSKGKRAITFLIILGLCDVAFLIIAFPYSPLVVFAGIAFITALGSLVYAVLADLSKQENPVLNLYSKIVPTRLGSLVAFQIEIENVVDFPALNIIAQCNFANPTNALLNKGKCVFPALGKGKISCVVTQGLSIAESSELW